MFVTSIAVMSELVNVMAQRGSGSWRTSQSETRLPNDDDVALAVRPCRTSTVATGRAAHELAFVRPERET